MCACERERERSVSSKRRVSSLFSIEKEARLRSLMDKTPRKYKNIVIKHSFNPKRLSITDNRLLSLLRLGGYKVNPADLIVFVSVLAKTFSDDDAETSADVEVGFSLCDSI